MNEKKTSVALWYLFFCVRSLLLSPGRARFLCSIIHKHNPSVDDVILTSFGPMDLRPSHRQASEAFFFARESKERREHAEEESARDRSTLTGRATSGIFVPPSFICTVCVFGATLAHKHLVYKCVPKIDVQACTYVSERSRPPIKFTSVKG